ncbi:hypothetical protein [Microcoleus sp.]|uniref:hypothetical protein n=1 Tax=Microcoleus sp. TaxID=44472 RepID=UPI003523DF42
MMEAAMYSFRQSDTLTRAIKECGTIELFGDKWPLTFDFLPTSALCFKFGASDRRPILDPPTA